MNSRLARSLVLVFLIIAVSIVGAVAFGSTLLAAGGTGPADALYPTGASASAAPHSQTWYRFDYTGDKSEITATLAAYGTPGIDFGVYLPDAITRWIAGDELKALGQSGKGTNETQTWVGRTNVPGTYYVIVRNNTDAAIGYTLLVTGDAVMNAPLVIPPTRTPLPNPFATPVPVGQVTGGKIAFQEASGGNIYTVGAEGSNLQRVTFGLDPALSPDGTRLAFGRQGPIAGLWVSDANGGNERLLYGAKDVRSPSWNADGSRVVFSTVTSVKGTKPFCFFGRCFGGDDIVKWRLKYYDFNEDKVVDLVTPGSGGTVPTLNRVNNSIAFMNPELGLMLTSFDSDTTPYVIDNDLSINSPVASPDGARLTYMVSQPPVWQIVASVWDGSNPTLLTNQDPLVFKHPNSVSPTWSPDGRTILFLSDRHGKWEFFAIDSTGANLRQVLKNITDQVTITYDFNAQRVASWSK